MMWYCGSDQPEAPNGLLVPGSGKIGVATSSDGINWNRGSGAVKGDRTANDVGACMEANPGDWWTLDTHSVATPDVQIFSSDAVNTGTGVYWMFYTGFDMRELELPATLQKLLGTELTTIEGASGMPGLAMSQDGRNFARIEAEHHTHAIFDTGKEGEWDNLFVASPQVLAAAPMDMRLYYHSFDASQDRFRIGVATSEDGFRWEKKGPVLDGGPEGAFDAAGVAAPCVVKDFDTRQYFMFYEGFGADGSRSIGLAVSEDGLTGWKRHSEPILKGGDAGAWDEAEVGAPCAVSMAQGRWRLYYSGKDAQGVWGGIGVALSEDDKKFSGAPVAFTRRTA